MMQAVNPEQRGKMELLACSLPRVDPTAAPARNRVDAEISGAPAVFRSLHQRKNYRIVSDVGCL